MQTGEPPESFYPPPHNGIECKKSEDVWKVNIVQQITNSTKRIQITAFIRAKTPEELLEKIKELFIDLGFKFINNGEFQYRRKLIPTASFESIYNETVVPNMQKLSELWKPYIEDDRGYYEKFLEKVAHLNIRSENDVAMFETIVEELQYAFYCWCVEQKLIEGKNI